jgi:hypothetical protein
LNSRALDIKNCYKVSLSTKIVFYLDDSFKPNLLVKYLGIRMSRLNS